LALNHQTTDRVPLAMVCSGINAPAHAQLEQYLRRERGIGVAEYLLPLLDIQGVQPDYIGPRLEQDTDLWGVRRKPMSYGEGHYSEIDLYPLAAAETIADLDAHRWPSPDWWDYEGFARKCRAARSSRDYALILGNGNILESSWYMRGFEQFLMDLALDPELAWEIMRRVADYYVEFFRRALRAADGEVDIAFTADDVGSQQGLLISLSQWEQRLKPHHQRLNAAIHEFGVKIMYHSDGAVMEAVPGLIDMGIDCLQALQFDAAGMDPVKLKDEYGDRLCFEGGVSVQHTLPFGTVEDVVRETQERIEVLAQDGGYILGPSHAIQAGTPPGNIVAMFDTAAACPLP
jgi:uroporphyrinogen decarboxylase